MFALQTFDCVVAVAANQVKVISKTLMSFITSFHLKTMEEKKISPTALEHV